MANLQGTYLTTIPETHEQINAGHDLVSIFLKCCTNIFTYTGSTTMYTTNYKDSPLIPVINFSGCPFFGGGGTNSGYAFKLIGKGNIKILTSRTTNWGTNVVQRWQLQIDGTTNYYVDDINTNNDVKGGYCLFDVDIPNYGVHEIKLICLTSGWDFIDAILYSNDTFAVAQWNATYGITPSRLNPILTLLSSTLQAGIQPVIPTGTILRPYSGEAAGLFNITLRNYETLTFGTNTYSRFKDSELAYYGHIRANFKFKGSKSLRMYWGCMGGNGQGTITVKSTDGSYTSTFTYTQHSPGATYRNHAEFYRNLELDSSKTYEVVIYSEYGYTSIDYIRIDEGGTFLSAISTPK